jgi:signal transduction histidine kinase
MRVRPGFLLLGWALLCGALRAHAADANRHVSIWVISAEGAGPNDIAEGDDLPARMEALRLSLKGTRVRLLNLEAPLAAKTLSWFPEYTVPNFQAVANQRTTFAVLARFGAQNNVDIDLRVITWRESTDLLRSARTAGPDALPDVMEVGEDWSGYLAANGRIRSRPNWQKRRGNWRDVLGVPACALPLITDVRLLFYWKRLPSAPPGSPPLSLDNASWPTLLDSVRTGTPSGETVAFPIGNSLNLLYDYVSLAMAGGSESILHRGVFGTRLSLSSQSALSVPIYIAEHSAVSLGKGESRQLVSFPEATHEEEIRTFVNGGYRATVEPASFMARWAHDFYERQRSTGKPKRFWDYAAATIPPGNFLGGGELVVMSTKPDPKVAFELADFVSTDPEYTAMLGRAGFLASGKPDYGTDAVVSSLVRDERDVQDARRFGEAVRKAIDQGHRSPVFEHWHLIQDPDVLDKLQRVWRRMAEGDVVGMRQDVKDVDWAVNSQAYLPSRALNALIQSWQWVALIFFMGTLLLLLADLHRRRLQQVERQFNMRLEERLNERTRIARDLHDTLLQSFQALLPHLQTVSNVLPSQPGEAKRRVDRAIEEAENAITDGRDTVHALRSGGSSATDLDSAISNFTKELLSGATSEPVPEIHVQVEGKSTLLNPVIRDEVYRIAAEAIRNAIRHANARRIDVEIRYDEQHLRLRIGDNGTGIDLDTLNRDHKAGHWGLRGMRERAKLVGGTLEVWSQPNVGTEIELSVPAASVYAKPSSRRRAMLSNFWRI